MNLIRVVATGKDKAQVILCIFRTLDDVNEWKPSVELMGTLKAKGYNSVRVRLPMDDCGLARKEWIV